MISVAFILKFIVAAVGAGTPLLFGTVGEIMSEKVGHLNLGVEGMMAIGAVAGFAAGYATGNLAAAMAAAFLAGMLRRGIVQLYWRVYDRQNGQQYLAAACRADRSDEKCDHSRFERYSRTG